MRAVRWSLILMTLVSVMADTMLLPFYPQFFQESFGVSDPAHAGWYIAACCTTVMLCFPLWAKVARRWHELPLWVVTQSVSAFLGVICYLTESLITFWVVSQLMLMMKASYLLIYPFAIRLEDNGKIGGFVALFAVLMHIGTISGAVLGGYLLQFWDGRDAYLIMIASDLVQIVICIALMLALKIRLTEPGYTPEDSTDTPRSPMVMKLAVVAMLFYFSVFLIRPFFTLYWADISFAPWDAEFPSSFVYAIPALIALLTVAWQRINPPLLTSQQLLVRGLFVLLVGLILQGLSDPLWTVLGRLIFGWGLFMGVVHIEVLLFANSRPERFGEDFSRVHLGQNIGIILASFIAGALVAGVSHTAVFAAAAVGIAAAALVAWRLGVFTPTAGPAEPDHSIKDAEEAIS